ncbi:MAG: PIN domain-containing protein [Armatimonadota bacterium]|nr:PIN domain-containing protein [Armatimonadota bacterium]
MSVYIDTSAFLAIFNSEDQRHEAAVRTWLRLIDDQELIVTANYVVVETTALLQSRHGIPAVRRLAEEMLPVVLIEWVDPSTHTAAMSAVLASSGNRSASFVDCISFEIIRKSHIANVFAYDRHFKNRGFDVIGESL